MCRTLRLKALQPHLQTQNNSAARQSPAIRENKWRENTHRQSRPAAVLAAAVGQDSSEDSSEEGVQLKPATKEDKKRIKMAKELEASALRKLRDNPAVADELAFVYREYIDCDDSRDTDWEEDWDI